MNVYPICLLGLEQQHIVIIGGGPVAERKALGLLEAGASVSVIAIETTEKLKELSSSQYAGRLELHERPFQSGDLDGASLVIAATNNPLVNQTVCNEAKRNNSLINVVDDPEQGNFISPAIVRRGDVVISISTGGSNPALARYLREKMESWISPDFGDLASLLAELRTSFNDVDRFDNVARLLDSDLQNILKQEGKEAARLYALKIIYES